MNLEQSVVLVDRALVTICAELPESLGLYNTAKDEFTIGALRSIPTLEHLLPGSRKHHIIRDWMRTYEEHEDQPLSSDVSLNTLREALKKEHKQRAKETRERNGELLSDDDDNAKEITKTAKANGKAKAKTKTEARNDAAKKKAEAKAKRKALRVQEVLSDSDASTSSTPSSDELDGDNDDSSSSDDSNSDDSSDDDTPRRSTNKSRNKTKLNNSKNKSKSKRNSGSRAAKEKRKATSNLPPIEVVLSSDEDDDEPNALFDAEDPDVYEVESILDKQAGRFGEPDKYLIKWVGYEETTWEPAENVSKDLIEEFDGQPVRENEYVVNEILDRKTVRDKETRLKTFKYLVKWVGYDDMTWEPASNLPHNLRRKFDTKYEARKRRRMS